MFLQFPSYLQSYNLYSSHGVQNFIKSIIYMDLQRGSKHSRNSNFFNRNESDSRRSSFISIDKFSDRKPSLSKRVSLINAMDIELSHASNDLRIDQDLMLDEVGKRFSDYRRSSNKSREPYSFTNEIQEKDLNRKSNYKAKHECSCQQHQCLSTHCICYLTPMEICVIGQCCPSCIQSKNEYLKSTKGYQLQNEKTQKYMSQQEDSLLNLIKQKPCKNMHYIKQVFSNEPCMKDLVFCTCKKSHCQKKYCLCFEKGLKCGEFCICIECHNKEAIEDENDREQERRWQRYATYKPYQSGEQRVRSVDQNIEQYLNSQMCVQSEQFNEVMEFEPVNFDNVLSHH